MTTVKDIMDKIQSCKEGANFLEEYRGMLNMPEDTYQNFYECASLLNDFARFLENRSVNT